MLNGRTQEPSGVRGVTQSVYSADYVGSITPVGIQMESLFMALLKHPYHLLSPLMGILGQLEHFYLFLAQTRQMAPHAA